MTTNELKNEIAKKEKELNALKKQLEKEEMKSKKYHCILVKHKVSKNGEETITESYTHHCGESHFNELKRYAKRLTRKSEKGDYRVWYQIIDEKTRNVIVTFE